METWSMIRVPAKLKSDLLVYGMTLTEQLQVRQQGNHDDPRTWEPPLWRVIALLLEHDRNHRERSRKNSGAGTGHVAFTQEGGIADGYSAETDS